MIRLLAMTVVATLSLCCIAVWRWNHALPRAAAQAYDLPRVAARVDSVDADSLEEALIETDMFRFGHDGVTAAATPFSGAATRIAASPQSLPPLVLKAIVGPPWQAVLDGIPNSPPGAVVQVGTSLGGVLVVSVGRDSVRVRGGDSVWTLHYRKAP